MLSPSHRMHAIHFILFHLLTNNIVQITHFFFFCRFHSLPLFFFPCASLSLTISSIVVTIPRLSVFHRIHNFWSGIAFLSAMALTTESSLATATSAQSTVQMQPNSSKSNGFPATSTTSDDSILIPSPDNYGIFIFILFFKSCFRSHRERERETRRLSISSGSILFVLLETV